ncbi:hypothetical protein E2C01_023848 [Portunus trituberculatus]|uniref:Uncharacterized protein n=1 Tax=Portunus trituberculatus TaxID=210409 RepID=A0A5B7E917_PORTR|nr:hypothetical protein [Portunus trituberculatus]
MNYLKSENVFPIGNNVNNFNPFQDCRFGLCKINIIYFLVASFMAHVDDGVGGQGRLAIMYALIQMVISG